MYKFIHEHDGRKDEVTFQTPLDDYTWDYLVEEFINFLRGQGFFIPEVEVVEKESIIEGVMSAQVGVPEAKIVIDSLGEYETLGRGRAVITHISEEPTDRYPCTGYFKNSPHSNRFWDRYGGSDDGSCREWVIEKISDKNLSDLE